MTLPADASRRRAAQLEQLTMPTGLLGPRGPAGLDPLSPAGLAVGLTVLQELRQATAHVPTAGKLCLHTGGVPGAGKTTALERSARDVFGRDAYAVVDPDQIRDRIFAAILDADGQHPRLRGLAEHDDLAGGPPTPRELSTALQPLAADVAKAHRSELLRDGRNLVVDGSMHSYESTSTAVGAAAARGYQVHAIYVDVDYSTARGRADLRWLEGVDRHNPAAPRGTDEWLGGRFVPDHYLMSMFPRGARVTTPAQNRDVFRRLVGEGRFATAAMYDGRPQDSPTLRGQWRGAKRLSSGGGPTRGSGRGGRGRGPSR